MTLDQLAAELDKRIHADVVWAKLIGKPPPKDIGFFYVEERYEAVVLGLLSPGQLLQMPTEPVCQALLEGIPVYYWPVQSYRSARAGNALCRRLQQVEAELFGFGVRKLPDPHGLITVSDAKMMRELGQLPAQGSMLTPLAKEWMEEHA